MDVRDITKTLPLGKERINILKGISFQIMSGEFVSIVGPSGSGKSTLLGIIAGLDNPTTGQVLIDGVDITRMTEGKLAAVRNSKIGMVFQAFNLIPTLTAQENVEVPLYVGKHKGSPSARAQELLALVGLSHRLDHRPNQLSGGAQQRAAVGADARSTAGRADTAPRPQVAWRGKGQAAGHCLQAFNGFEDQSPHLQADDPKRVLKPGLPPARVS